MASNKDNVIKQFKHTKGQVIFVGKYMEVYIPETYFDSSLALITEDRVETLGIFMFRLFKNEDKKDKLPMNVYKLPSTITLRPSNIYKEKLNINGNIDDFEVLQFYTDDIFIDNTTIIKSAMAVNGFIAAYHAGKLPKFLNYEDPSKLEVESIVFNDMDFPVPSTVFEIINSELYRDPSDINKSYRFKAADGASGKDYTPINIQTLPSLTSTFSGVTFEDVDYQLTVGINNNKMKREESISPLEKTIKY